MKAKYIEKRSKYLIARNVGVLICFWISFYKYILIAYKKDIHSSSFFKRNVARRTEHCFVSTHPPPHPPNRDPICSSPQGYLTPWGQVFPGRGEMTSGKWGDFLWWRLRPRDYDPFSFDVPQIILKYFIPDHLYNYPLQCSVSHKLSLLSPCSL